MLRNLPEGSRYTAALSVDRTTEEPEDDEALSDPRMEAVMDARTWTLDRRLKAIEINAMYSLIQVSGQWKDGKPPHFPTIGPADWQEPNTKSNELKDNYDVLKRMGWPGG